MRPGIGKCEWNQKVGAESMSRSSCQSTIFAIHTLIPCAGVPIPSIWGHWAGGPGDSIADVKWLDEKLRDFFAEV
jgi:hypothetical protein